MNPKRRHQEANDQIAAAKVMPGSADTNPSSSPMQTPEAAAARESVKGRANIPSQLSGTTFAKPARRG